MRSWYYNKLNRSFVLIIIALVVVVLVVYVPWSKTKHKKDKNTSNNNISEPYFIPSSDLGSTVVLSGIVRGNSQSSDNQEQQYQLVDSGGKVIAYIYSTTNDLRLSVGLNVEVSGKVLQRKLDNYQVISVEKIKLK